MNQNHPTDLYVRLLYVRVCSVLGQYIKVSCTAIQPEEFHSLTITSAPHEGSIFKFIYLFIFVVIHLFIHFCGNSFIYLLALFIIKGTICAISSEPIWKEGTA